MNNFKFDLQLFAEEPAGAEQEVEQPVTEDSTSENDDSDFLMGIDDNGDFVFNSNAFNEDTESKDETDGQPESKEPATQTEEPAEEPEQTYIVKVDGKEEEVTLNQLLEGYMRQSDYTRKTQQLADERRNMQQQYQPQSQPVTQQVSPRQMPPQQGQGEQTPPSQQFTQADYYKQLSEFAKEAVRETTGETYDPYNDLHNAIFSNAIADVKAEMFMQRQAEQERIQADNQFREQLGKFTSDPNFHEIDVLAQQKLNSLPYSDAIKIQEAFNRRDWSIIDPYLTAVRNEYYGQNQVPSIRPKTQTQEKPKVTPPFVESAGAAEKNPDASKKVYELNNLGKMTNDDLADMFSKIGLTNL